MCICPKKAILPSGTLKPNSSNLSTKMLQSKQIINSKYSGMTFYRNYTEYVDILIGTIQYIKQLSFYYKSNPIPFNILYSDWESYHSTYDEAIKYAAIYLTLLSTKKIPNNIVFPFFYKNNVVYSLGFQNGSIVHYTMNPADAYYYAYIKK